MFFLGTKDGNDSSGIIKIFSKKPNNNELIKIIRSTNVFGHSGFAKSDEKIITEYEQFKFDVEYNRIFSEGFKIEHKLNLIFT